MLANFEVPLNYIPWMIQPILTAMLTEENVAPDKSFFKKGALFLLAIFGWCRIKVTGKPTLLILTYHRILPKTDPRRGSEQAGMVTAPQAFEKHIQLFKALGGTPIHLHEWIEKNRNGDQLPPLSVAVTFDDGWRDNYEYAYPLLLANDIPFTIFLVSKLIDTERTFWPEQVLQLLLAENVPWQDGCFDWLRPAIGAANGDSTHPPFDLAVADLVIGELKRCKDETIYTNLQKVYESHPYLAPNHSQRAILNSAELEEMAASGLARYGAHTRHHYRLNRLDSEYQLRSEIVDCMDDIKALTPAHVPIFCYPNGDITASGTQLVKSAYTAACTTKTGWNLRGCDPFDLHRFNLHDGNSFSPSRLLATIGRGLL